MIVVGASVAGLYAAYRLAQAGMCVRVFEAEPEIRPEARTLIVTPAWLRMCDFDVAEAVLNRTGSFELISGGASARVALPPDQAADTVRCWFDRGSTRFFYWLIPESEETGAVGLIDEDEEAAAAAGRVPRRGLRPAVGVVERADAAGAAAV